MCSSPSSAFAWIGAVLVNIGFILLIGWGESQWWPLGFALSLLYTLFLFGLANKLDRRHRGDEQENPNEEEEEEEGSQQHRQHLLPTEDENTTDETPAREDEQQQQHDGGAERDNGALTTENVQEDTTSNTAERRVPVLVSLLFGLAVVSLGVTGYLVVINLLPQQCSGEGSWRPKWEWTIITENNTTNTTDGSIPEKLQAWANRPIQERSVASFGYISDADTTLFSGCSALEEPYQPCLWSTQPGGGAPPAKHCDHRYPDHFTTLSNSTVCFLSLHTKMSSFVSRPTTTTTTSSKGMIIFCSSDGSTFRAAKEEDPAKQPSRSVPQDFVASDNGELWFKKFPSNYQETGHLVYSLDPATMIPVLHSHRVKARNANDNDGDDPCQWAKRLRQQAILALFVSAIPVTAVSLGLWIKKQIPSMGSTTYVGLTLIYVCIYVACDPWDSLQRQKPLEWWFAISGVVWIFVLSFLSLMMYHGSDNNSPSHHHAAKDSFQWGLVIGGMAFFGGMTALLLDSIDDSTAELWHWVELNLLAFIPLIVLGLATNTTFLMILGALGFLMDSWRLSTFVGDHVKGSVSVPIQFLVFSVAGLSVGGTGKLLSQHQRRVHVWSERRVQDIVGRCHCRWLGAAAAVPHEEEDVEQQQPAAGAAAADSLTEPLLTMSGQDDEGTPGDDDPNTPALLQSSGRE